jgi:lipoate synthase
MMSACPNSEECWNTKQTGMAEKFGTPTRSSRHQKPVQIVVGKMTA